MKVGVVTRGAKVAVALVLVVWVGALAKSVVVPEESSFEPTVEPSVVLGAHTTANSTELSLLLDPVCVDDAQVTELPSEVRVTATSTNGDCLGPFLVDLDRPLGERTVVDGRTGVTVPVTAVR